MFKNLKSKFIKGTSAVFLAAVLMQSAFAYTGSYSFSIPNGSSTWNGKSNGDLWNYSSSAEASWVVNPSKSVTGKLYKIREFNTDLLIASGTFGTNGGTKSFVPNTDDVSYYAVLTRSQKDGVTGTTSARN